VVVQSQRLPHVITMDLQMETLLDLKSVSRWINDSVKPRNQQLFRQEVEEEEEEEVAVEVEEGQ